MERFVQTVGTCTLLSKSNLLAEQSPVREDRPRALLEAALRVENLIFFLFLTKSIML